MSRAGSIYHLAPESELRAGPRGGMYFPRRLPEDGFVHCSGSRDLTLAVASDYFADLAEPLYVLEIDPGRLSHELRFEAASPLEGVGRAHLADAVEFPHVYGPIDLAAITGAGRLARSAGGRVWPTALVPLDHWIRTDPIHTNAKSEFIESILRKAEAPR